MAAGDVSQTTPVQNIHAFYWDVLNKLSMCNFDSSKIFTCYMLCIDSKVNNSTDEFWVLSLGFPIF